MLVKKWGAGNPSYTFNEEGVIKYGSYNYRFYKIKYYLAISIMCIIYLNGKLHDIKWKLKLPNKIGIFL